MMHVTWSRFDWYITVMAHNKRPLNGFGVHVEGLAVVAGVSICFRAFRSILVIDIGRRYR